MRRYDDWPERLAAFFAGRRRVPFVWGINDCGIFSCDAVLLITGIDLAADVRGKYRDEDGAAIAMGGGLEEFADRVAAENHIAEIPVRMAGRGDLALHTSLAGITLGIVGMSGMEIVVPGDFGYRTLPLLECSKAWRI